MLRRSLLGLGLFFLVCGMCMGEEFRGNITKIEDDTITVTPGFGGFGFGKKKGDGEKKAEPKTFKISKDIKVIRVAGKDKEEIKLTLEELKTALKVSGQVFVTVVHEGDAGSEIKVGFGGLGKGKKKDDK
jgi:hypothetical protein